ncbi:hypothetical protein ABW20_dc0101559 [Dactylellina cionopaga]|nr:hypothetical protein ABW20_dc0101559 [Dactylellina cionopaga]
MSLSSVRKTVFNPLLQTKDEIISYLKSLPTPNGTAHPFNKSLLLLENEQIQEIDISDKNEDYFFSATDLNTLSETITSRIELFSAQLEKFKSYQIISLVNPYLEIPFVPDEPSVVVLSVRSPTFYDFCLGNAAGNMVLFSNNTHTGIPGIAHSGDVTQGNNLLQHVKFDGDMSEEPFVLFVSGYSHNALHLYKPQSPAMTICDHVSKIMYVVPVPLDQATIGEATLCVPVVGRRRGDKVCFSVLPSAITSNQVAGGSQLNGDTLARAIAREPAAPPPPQTLTDTPGTTAKPGKKRAKTDEGATETLTIVEVDIVKPLFVTEEGCKFPEFAKGKDANHITFFQGITVHSEQPDDVDNKDKKVVLPCALGNPLEGSMILAVGKPFTGAKVTNEQYNRLFDTAPLILFTVSDRMSDQARVLNPDIRCNALYIVQTTVPIPDQSTLSVEDMLNDTKVNAITSLAGPQSIVVVQLGERYYFYRGIRWPGLLDEIPKFGEDITETIEAIFEAKDVAKNPWNNITSIAGDPKVYFRGTICSPDDLYTNFTSLKLEELETFKADILDTLSQLQIVISPKELPEFTARLQTALKKTMDDLIAPHKKEYIDTLLASKGRTRDPKLMEKYRRVEKQAKVALQWLIDALGALVSSRISSTRKYDLKQMIRKQQILGNVAASKDMTYEGLADLLEEHCSEIGMQLTDDSGRVCSLDNRIQYLSGLDCGIILPLSQEGHRGPLAMESEKLAIAFPYGVSEDKSGSAFAFACFDQFINIKHPYSQFWIDLCNLHHVSMFRILQRNTISSAVQSREYQIPPQSADLGFMLVYALTDTMKSLAANRSGIPKEARFGEDVDSTTKMMRGLFGYLMTMLASGVQPMSMAWQMLSKSTTLEIPPQNEFWLYSRIIELFPYTAWPQAQFKKNVRWLFARILRKQIADPVTKPLRDSMNEIKEGEVKEWIKKRNEQLKWTEVVVEVLSTLLLGEYKGDEGKEKVKEIAGRLVGLVPKEELTGRKGRRGLTRIMRAFSKLQESGDVEKIDKDTRNDAAGTYAKRSAALKEVKERFLEAAGQDAGEAKKAYDELRQKRELVANKFKVKTAKLQNHKNIGKVWETVEKGEIVDKKNLGLLKSDAEISREPWLVGKPEEPVPSKIHLVHYVLTGEMTAPDDTKSKAVVIEKPKTLDQRLSALPAGDKAGKLALVVEKLKDTKELIAIAKLPEKDFMLMFNFCNGNTEEGIETLKKAIVEYLEGWADVVAAELRVVELLRGPKGKSEEKDIAEADSKAGISKAPENTKKEDEEML